MALVAPATSEVEPQPMPCTAPRNISLIWHRRLGHIGNTSLLKMAANNRAFGLLPTATMSPNTLCWARASGKAVRQPFPTSGHISTKPLQLLHTDIAGPMPTASARGAKYFVTVLDDFSKFKAVKPIAKRNDAPSFIKEVILNWASQTNHKTAAIRHDRAKEYMEEELTDWFESRGIELQPTTSYSPQENGDAERLNWTLWETTLAMLADSGLPDKWWAEALSHACHLRNVCLSAGGLTLWELLKGGLPDLRTLRVFGAPCMVKVPDERRNKLQHKTQPG
jgi:transposase InsO family protein